MMTATFDDLLAALSERIGLALSDDGNGVCAFSIENRQFSIFFDDERERVVVTALVANDLPPNPSRRLVTDLLNLGFGMAYDGLPAVGRDPEFGFLSAFVVFSAARLNVAEFPDEFEKFVAFAMNLAERLGADSDGEASVVPSDEIDAPTRPTGGPCLARPTSCRSDGGAAGAWRQDFRMFGVTFVSLACNDGKETIKKQIRT